MRTTVDAVEAAWVEKLDTVEKAWIQNLTTAKHEHQQEVERLQERLKTQEDDALREGEARHRDWLNKEAAMQVRFGYQTTRYCGNRFGDWRDCLLMDKEPPAIVVKHANHDHVGCYVYFIRVVMPSSSIHCPLTLS